jgi:hypothetical protein
MKKIIMLLMIALLLISIAGCKEEGSGAKKTAATKDSAAEDSLDADPAEADADAEEESSGLADDFVEMMSKKTALKYTVTYKMTGSSQGSSFNYQMTQYFGGADRFRMDSANSGVETRSYLMDNKFYSCTQQGGKWNCFSIESQTESPTKQFDDIAENPTDYRVTPDGTKSVAGTTAKCYKITTPQGNVRECLSKEGVPLYMETTFQGGSTKKEATSYKASVKDSDFQLPAEPVDMNAMIAQYQQQMPEGYGQ